MQTTTEPSAAVSAQTVRDLTDSILSVYGDCTHPDTWGAYVMAVESEYGTHPLCAAHRETVYPTFEDHWLRRFGIGATKLPDGNEPSGVAQGMFCAP